MPVISPRRLARLTWLEICKLRRQRLSLFVLGLPAVVSASVPQGFWLASAEGLQGFLAFSTALNLALLLGCFLLLIHASASIAWERSEKTLRNYLTGPVKRSEVFLSRFVALELEMLLLLSLVVVAAHLSTNSHFAFEDIRGEAIEPLFLAEDITPHLWLAIAYFVPAAAALVSVGLLVSVICATPAVATALALSLLLCLDIAKSVFSGRSNWVSCLFSSYLPTLFDRTSYLFGVQGMSEGKSDALWPDSSPHHWFVWIVPAATLLVSVTVSLAIFVRRDYAE